MKRLIYFLSVVLILCSCAAPEVLEPRSGVVPPGVDLSGNWQIRSNNAADQRQLQNAIRNTDGARDDELFRKSERQTSTQSRQSRQRRVNAGLVYIFLELGETLKVTQTPHGLFISFDRSVVEEFRFGESRMINVGEVEAQRVTGWDGETLIVDTLDRNSMKLTEQFRLIENNQVLERTITLRSKARDEESIVQLFDRAAD